MRFFVLAFITLFCLRSGKANSQQVEKIDELLRLELSEAANSIQWHPVDSRIAVTSTHFVYFFDSQTGKLLTSIDLVGGIASDALWSPDGKKVAILWSNFIDTPNVVVIWDVDSNTMLLTLETDAVYSVAWSPNGLQLITVGGFTWEDRKIEIWNSVTGEKTRSLNLNFLYTDPDYPDTPSVAGWLTEKEIVIISQQGIISFIDLENEKTTDHWYLDEDRGIGNPIGYANNFEIFALNPINSQILALPFSTREKEALFIGNLSTRHELAILPENAGYITSLEWHSLGTLLASGTLSGFITLWDTDTQKVVIQIDLQASTSSLAWEPGGDLLAATTLEGSVYIWDFSDLIVAQ